jgi:hypothetical protein
MVRLRVASPTGIFRAHGPGSGSGNSFDVRLRKFPTDPLGPLSAERIHIKTGKARPARDRLLPQWRHPEILS